jgi:hypothetical protein
MRNPIQRERILAFASTSLPPCSRAGSAPFCAFFWRNNAKYVHLARSRVL